ncbi:hypothetical protein FAZ15_10045 [Sphingobacterium olei]|uniref:Uncharacterized protein n=1 Tax=Sphingobacterium olei TaxID=2571155 RepID=A0A4U0P2U5_9SPHI|nr:hypothetical protein [Sphingobacterium olei]TJZ61519.1 hypothetical protein FAZ15_10045 [Sphingobacterium olei]
MAGPLANLAVGLFFYFTFPLSTHFGQETVVGISFGIFNILVFVVNLYPREESINGIKFNSDGLQIKKALMGEYKEAVGDELVLSNLLDGEDFFQQKSYDEALALYQSNLNKLNESSELTSYVAPR